MNCEKASARKTINVNEGDRYGNLTIIQETEPRVYKKYKDRRVLCKCNCGNIKVMSLYPLIYGKVISCGCLHKEQGVAVGKKNLKYAKDDISVKLHSIWHGMKCRCNTKSSGSYSRYGAKGITICSEWNNDFTAFYDWAISNGYSDNLTIDRIDYNGIYEPSNCRWVSASEQANNRSTNVRISYNGEEHTLAEWSKILGINRGTLYSRKRNKWSNEKILSTTIKHR